MRPDGDGPQDLRPRADNGAIGDSGMALAVDLGCGIHRRRHAAQRHSVIEGDVIADLCGLANHHAHAVIDEQPAPDGGAGMYLDPGQGAPELGHNPPKQALTVAPEPMGWAVEEQNMHTRISKQHLHAGARSRVPGYN